MKFSPPLAEAKLIRRYKRFLADIELDNGEIITIHCPNTGSMKNCAEPGSKVWYSTSDNAKRKYPHTWEIVSVGSRHRAGINTARANGLVEEAILENRVPELSGYAELVREVRYGEEKSRIDILLSRPENSKQAGNCFVEVKNVTLGLGGGKGVFPDAVTARGAKHLRELILQKQQGDRAVLFFCVQHSGIDVVAPADEIDPEYGRMLREAVNAGVEVLAYKAKISAREIKLTEPVEVKIV